MLGCTIGYKKLARIRILAFVRHCQHPSVRKAQRPIQLILKICPPDALSASSRTCRISALDHKVLDVAVEYEVLVVPRLRKAYEVPYGSRGVFGIEFDVYVTVIRRNSRKSDILDELRVEHVFFIRQGCDVNRRVRSEACGCKGCGSLAGCM